MLKFSANYAKTNNNFVIQNISEDLSKKDKYFPILCVLKNILQRGCPTLASKYLLETFGNKLLNDDVHQIFLIDKEAPKWGKLIGGDEEGNYFPARVFFEEIIPEYLNEFKFIQQLLLPEASLSEITDNNNVFSQSRVDFYLPQAKLVIEIDGSQHKGKNAQREDKERDQHLYNHGITTVRVESKDISEKSAKLNDKIDEIKNRLNEHRDELNRYRESFLNDVNSMENKQAEQSLLATAVIRFQIAILTLLERGSLKLNDSSWDIQVLERDVHGFANIAINDLFLWLKNLCRLAKIDFEEPRFNIKTYHSEIEFNKDDCPIKIDFSLFKRWTDECEQRPKIIFVRTDYFDNNNYFKVSTSDPIKYKVILDGKDSDYNCLVFVLENIFGFNQFNSGQLPIITNALRCFDTLGLLPTGSGKSLCYQLVALLQPCISFVVDPIKSLMYDQKDNLDKRYITHTNFISSDQSPNEKSIIQKEFAEGKYLFIWISPERFQTQTFRDYLTYLNQHLHIGMAVIDEVHCVSEWGHDFRTSYLNLSKTIRAYCPGATVLGLTATASVNVLKDILIEFNISNDNVKTLPSFTRPELKFIVIKDNGETNEKTNNIEELIKKLDRQRNVLSVSGDSTMSGLIFTTAVNGDYGCYVLSNYLTDRLNTKVNWYSGTIPRKVKMSDKEFNKYKKRIQEEFKNNEFPLLVATKAFGMGIDKSNIRYTIHYGIPGSMEALYQEAGRAGRDKKRAACYVLYSPEKAGKEYINHIFDLNSSVDDIKRIYEKIDYTKARDIFGNVFFWLNSNEPFDEDFKNMKRVFSKIAEPKETKTAFCTDVSLNLSQLQKIIYKLSIIGIVEDWIVNDWNSQRGSLEVTFADYTDESIMESLIKYIHKYDKNFDLNDESKMTTLYREIACKDFEKYEKAYKILICWQYENIAYNRRQSIKNLADLCEKFSDSKKFQNEIEAYFKFTDLTYMFDSIAEKPTEYNNWFKTLFKAKGNLKEKLSKEDIEEIKINLSRFLESYRYNMGLNFLSGFLRLILKDYDDVDGKARLQSAFEQINRLPEEDRMSILHQTLEIGKIYLDEEGKEDLSEMIIKNYQEGAVAIYTKFEDNYSLNHILSNSISRLNGIGEDLL